jgi:type I site-specific restriction endonuclease
MIPIASDTEADTCRKHVLPKLYAAGWTDDQISERRYFTDGRIVGRAARSAAWFVASLEKPN